MSINDLITRTAVQTAVYWPDPVEDGFGTKTYGTPVEITCRWEAKQQLVRAFDAKGNTYDYICIAYVTQDLDMEGVLYLGRLTDLTAQEITTPAIKDGTYVIKQFEKVPSLYSTTDFLRRAFLTQWQYR